MPRIANFYGIDIYMYYLDHNPPHFHVLYSGQRATVDIQTGSLITGKLPRRAAGLVNEWHGKHQTDLLERWEQARCRKTLTPISPLS